MENVHSQLTHLNSQLGETPIDVFICSASYEARCKSITDHLGDIRPIHSIVAYDEYFLPLVEKNLGYLTERLVAKSGEKQHFKLTLDSNQPIRTADNIAEKIGGVIRTEPQRFVIDTTTFTRESLLILICFLKQSLKPSDSVDFLYAHAKEYSAGDEYKDKWLSKGIREVRSVLGYPGDLLPSRRNHLIILVGFEDERALSLIRECEPAHISLGIADKAEAGTGPHQNTNEHRLARLKNFLVESSSDFVFKGYNAEVTRKILLEQVVSFPDLNTIIAPMNTKISTIAAGALALENKAIQICYAQANIYNYSRYSLPDQDFYLFRLPGFP